ncbi:MAG: hypothetical protein H0W64_01185 [Gammaproteobacteria bacterium]|nr:hypothetical protein [Gammaproteobacteria bacterium]
MKLSANLVGMALPLLAICAAPSLVTAQANNFIQSIQVVNLLANTTLPDPGMTPTTIIVKYYNNASYPCWVSTLSYQQDTAIHAGPTQGCVTKVNMVEITPLLVGEKLRTYQGPVQVQVDTSKYASQITVVQNQAPVFDPSNGLIVTPGTIKAKVQAQFK